MTLSPGQKVQPKRSMRTSPGGFSALCSSILSERAPRPPRFIGHSHLAVAYRVKPETLRDPLLHDRQELPHPLLGAHRIDEIEVTAFGRGEIRTQALADARRGCD